jgi:hypothetical protein
MAGAFGYGADTYQSLDGNGRAVAAAGGTPRRLHARWSSRTALLPAPDQGWHEPSSPSRRAVLAMSLDRGNSEFTPRPCHKGNHSWLS